MAMPRGLPRPRNADGWPIPYNIDEAGEHMGTLDTDRQVEIFLFPFCQTCGLELDYPCYAVNTLSADQLQHMNTVKRLELLVLDNGCLHEACLRLALAWCPHLKAARAMTIWAFDPERIIRTDVQPYSLIIPPSAVQVTHLFLRPSCAPQRRRTAACDTGTAEGRDDQARSASDPADPDYL